MPSLLWFAECSLRTTCGATPAVVRNAEMKSIAGHDHAASGRLKVDNFATHHFKLHEMMDAYDTFGRAAETKALKVIIDR